MLAILQLPVLNDNYIYLLHDPVSGETAVVDPAVAQPVLDVLKQKGWQLTTILNTHHHADHVGGNLELKQKTGCTVIAPLSDQNRIPGIDRGVVDDDVITLGKHSARVISTPGHTSGHVVYHFTDDNTLFCGDTLFVMGCGRLFEGTAEQMWHSLQKLKALPASTQIYCAHEYTQANGRFALTVEPDNRKLQQRMEVINQLRANHLPTVPSTIKQELATNPFFREDSLALQETIKRVGKNPVEVFAEVRRLKDCF
ncbi:MAG: hydroxyacylglutathione hydrolase [Methylobacter sp.]|uniref:Hydroxyacylglutathione hydrolase n=1 Tax=Candidatus Methylobacter titanis TaxID=3053457 RepID=A0AA43Q5E8_9GAMM|nr:hydroxyacylglutathione hydrolase [Candidatus Methylobacter titanis]MDI1293552.1 hydroxyacylglutathione hydrolase [Candidatus Methylobacter titanis]